MPGPPRLILCPYCGNTQHEPEDRCAACGGFFDPLSIKITQQHMGPWFVRSRHQPFRPGCSYDVLVREIEKGKIHPTTIIRGPTTRQLWSVARHVPGVAHRLGFCHACQIKVNPASERCASCGAVFFSPKLRDNLGLAPAGVNIAAQPTKLTDTGSYPAQSDDPLGKPDRDEHLQLGVLARAFDSQEIEPDATPVIHATAIARTDRDAMTWIAGNDAQESDTLTTTDDADAVPASSAWAWMLIVLNVIVLMCLVAAILVVVQQAGQPRTATSQVDAIATTPPVPASPPAELPPPPATVAQPAIENPQPVAPPQPAEATWANHYESALKLEADGQFDQAIAELHSVKSQAPAEMQPDIDQTIARVQTKLDRLALQKLFGQ